MSDVSKDALMGIFQQRMDKCTNEQFWAVAALTALYAGIFSKPGLPPGVPKWLGILAISVASLYGVLFVVHRHRDYYLFRKDFSGLVKDCPFAPDFLKEVRSAWKLSRLTGLIFYSVWIIGGYAATLWLLLKP